MAVFAARCIPHDGEPFDAFFDAESKEDAKSQAENQLQECCIPLLQIKEIIIYNCASDKVPDDFSATRH